MKLFVTGASGYIGTAVVQELLQAGHEVIGLARSDVAAETLQAAGAKVQRGDLDDLDSLRAGATASDGVIHLAYMHDFTDITRGGTADLKAVEVFADILKNTDKPFIGTSGTLVASHIVDRPTTEEDAGQHGARRVDVEELTLAMANQGIRSSFVRLAPTVHSSVDRHGFIPSLITIARTKGISGYVGDGLNRWPAVHLSDAARLFRLAAEQAVAGSRLHGVGEEGISFKQIAQAIGDQLQVPTASITSEDATDHFGFLGALVGIDNPTSSALTQARLNWQPTGPGLIADLMEGHYFQT
jgi:nucleoside-diphosphate-sugar epimerase